MTNSNVAGEQQVADYLDKVREALRESGHGQEQTEGVIESLWAQIEDTVQFEGREYGDVLNNLDPPEAFAAGTSGPARETSRLGWIGLVSGTTCLVVGQMLSAFTAPPVSTQIGDPLIVLAAMVSLGLGWASWPSRGSRASMVFGAILLAIIVAAILMG